MAEFSTTSMAAQRFMIIRLVPTNSKQDVEKFRSPAILVGEKINTVLNQASNQFNHSTYLTWHLDLMRKETHETI